MERYIPYEKMSKRQKKEWNARKRILWSSNPVTRKIEDKKRYNRKRFSESTEAISLNLFIFALFRPKAAFLFSLLKQSHRRIFLPFYKI